MTQQTSPFIEGKFGWALGEGNWNLGMDENLLKFSYLFDRNIDGIVASLPAPVNGEAYFNTTDNRIYYVVNGVFSSTPVPKWFIITDRSTGLSYQFTGTALESIKGSQNVPTISALKALSKNSSVKYATVFGYSAAGDNGGGLYYLDPADTTTADNGGTVIVATDGGRWKLNHNGDVSVLQFGADPSGVVDCWQSFENALAWAPGNRLVVPKGLYRKNNRNRIYRGTHLVLAPEAIIQRYGSAEAWMFVNGEVGNTTYATGYDGDGDIRISGGKFDLGGFPGRSAAAFVIGHTRRVIFENCHFYNGYDSHNIEINASEWFMFLNCTFENQGYSNTTSSFEVVNIDYASAAGFPGFGDWDNTPDRGGLFIGCKFRNVQGGISSHSVPVASPHSNIKIIGCTFEDVATRPIRMQGWDGCTIQGNYMKNSGFEAITILTGNNNIVTGNHIVGASTTTNGQSSAIRIDGNNNIAKDNDITSGGYANTYAYPYGVASGTKNKIGTKGALPGTNAPLMISDGGTLTEINNRTLLFSGTASGAGTVVSLADDLNNYVNIEVSTGAVGSGFYQTDVSRPFVTRNWAVGTDRVAVTTAQGRFVAVVTTLTSLTISSSSDALRHIYGVSE